MSPASQSGWDGTSLPATLRGPHRRWMSDAFPQMTDAGVIERRQRPDNWLEPVYDLMTIRDEWEALHPARHEYSPEGRERLEALLTAAREAERSRWEADWVRGKSMLERAREVSLAVRTVREETA